MTSSSQVLIQQRKNGNADHRNSDCDLESLERHTEQQECAQARTDDRKSDRGQQAVAVEGALANERHRATNAHKDQGQHVGCNRNVGFNAESNHHGNGDERCTARNDADHAGKEEDGNKN